MPNSFAIALFRIAFYALNLITANKNKEMGSDDSNIFEDICVQKMTGAYVATKTQPKRSVIVVKNSYYLQNPDLALGVDENVIAQ